MKICQKTIWIADNKTAVASDLSDFFGITNYMIL